MRRLPVRCRALLVAAVLAGGTAAGAQPAAPSKPVIIGPLGGAERPARPSLPSETPEPLADPETAKIPVQTLIAALERAYWTSPKVLAERARLKSTDFRVPQARALFGPRLSYQAGYNYQRDNLEQPAGNYLTLSGWSTVAALVFNQPLFTFGRNAAGERTAAAQVAFERALLRYTEQQALFDTIGAYALVLRDRASVGIVRDDVALLEQERSDTEIRFAGREVTATDRDQVRTRVEVSRAQLFSAQRLAASSDARFLSVVGAPAGELAQPNPLPMPVKTLEQAYAYAELHDPVLEAAQAREQISRAQRAAAKADMLPRVDVTGRAETGALSPYSDSLRATRVTGQVTISGPIFESGLRRARLAEAEAANDADWRLIDSAVREQRAAIADAWNDWVSQTAAIARWKAAAAAAQTAYSGAVLQERAALRSTLDVVDLARELLNARSSENAAQAGAYVAQARLLAAIGALDYPDLLPDAPAYDPQTHFDRVRDNGDVPLLTPLLRTIDGVTLGSNRERPSRDPAADLGMDGVLPAPSVSE